MSHLVSLRGLLFSFPVSQTLLKSFVSYKFMMPSSLPNTINRSFLLTQSKHLIVVLNVDVPSNLWNQVTDKMKDVKWCYVLNKYFVEYLQWRRCWRPNFHNTVTIGTGDCRSTTIESTLSNICPMPIEWILQKIFRKLQLEWGVIWW